MQTRIGHLHVRYRVPQGSPSASVAVPTLDRTVRERLTSQCDQALGRVFEDDPAVYVLRNVSSRVGILCSRVDLESRLARQWGRRICAAVVRCIATTEDGEKLVRFENQAEFVSRFLTDLTIDDGAWERWYYGAFRGYSDLPEHETILAVLLDNREFLWEVLSRLRQSNALDAVIALLGPEGQRRLWGEVARSGQEEAPAEAFRIFVQSAFRVLDALELWSGHSPSEAATLDAYLRTRPVSPRWTSTVSLADAVANVIRFLAAEGKVSVAGFLNEEPLTRLEHTLTTNFDWLDREHLARRVVAIVQAPAAGEAKSFILRPSGATPSQRRLLEVLLRIVTEGRCRLDPGEPVSEANLLRLVAALSEESRSGSVSSVTWILESVVEAWNALRGTVNPFAVLSELRRGGLEPILSKAEPTACETMARALEVIARSGEPAIELTEELLRQFGDAQAMQDSVVIKSQCAGLFLLVRAVQDIRLGAVLKECNFESIEPVLTGLAIRMGGALAWLESTLDRGAALWAGVDAEQAAVQLARLDSLDRDRFQSALLDLLTAQRVTDLSEAGSLDAEPTGPPCASETILMLDRVATWLLRAWARWLPGLNSSSVPYLLRNFIRRPGTIAMSPKLIEVHLEPAPLDAILRMARYLDDSPGAPWLSNRPILFRIA